MRLRRLELKDSELMLEWMQDSEVVKDLKTDFQSKTIEDCRSFIKYSWKCEKEDFHLAITDDNDVYQGTVSLKKINAVTADAEFAITIRQCAMGKGIAIGAMKEILKRGIEELNLKRIYWCVDSKNVRAVRFYEKNKFKRIIDVPQYFLDRYSECSDLIWYLWEA